MTVFERAEPYKENRPHRKERLLKMNEQNKSLPMAHEDYEAILRQAVAVIEHVRQEIARHVNVKVLRSVAFLPWEKRNN